MTSTKSYEEVLFVKKGMLTAVSIQRGWVTDNSKKCGKKLRTMITARCDCGNLITVKASEYNRTQTCGCRGIGYNKYVPIVKRKVEPVYEPCTVNGVALADYLRVYRETERKERDKDTRKLFCHSVETNISILRSH